MDTVSGVYGLLRSQLEGLFSTGLPNTPLHNVNISVVSGNFVTAKPLGILDGVDRNLFTGQLRNLDISRVQRLLDANSIVLQLPLGFSSSGQAFNLASEELVLADISIALQADKVIFFDTTEYLKAQMASARARLHPALLKTISTLYRLQQPNASAHGKSRTRWRDQRHIKFPSQRMVACCKSCSPLTVWARRLLKKKLSQ